MIRFGRVLMRNRRGIFSAQSQIENAFHALSPSARGLDAFKFESTSLYVIKRGVKTTDTYHPEPVYNEDERILEKVMEERHKDCDDLPIGMANPYEKPIQKCILCEHGVELNWKNVKLIYQFLSPYTGQVYEPHVTGLCKKQYENLLLHVKLASRAGLISTHVKPAEYRKDPILCDPERPVKPHKYC